MTETQRLNYRLTLLLQLRAALPRALTEGTLQIGLHTNGFKTTEDELQTELSALEELEMITPYRDPINAGIRQYKITEPGRAHLARNNL